MAEDEDSAEHVRTKPSLGPFDQRKLARLSKWVVETHHPLEEAQLWAHRILSREHLPKEPVYYTVSHDGRLIPASAEEDVYPWLTLPAAVLHIGYVSDSPEHIAARLVHTLSLMNYFIQHGDLNNAVSQAFKAGTLWRDGQNTKLIQARAGVRKGAQKSAESTTLHSAKEKKLWMDMDRLLEQENPTLEKRVRAEQIAAERSVKPETVRKTVRQWRKRLDPKG